MKLEWFALATQFQQENTARHSLAGENMRCLLPFERCKIPLGRKRIPWKLIPLFPGYLFVQCRWNLHVAKVLACKGVQSFVGFRNGVDRPVAIHPTNMNDLFARLEEYRGWDVLINPVSAIERGTLVHALVGPFRNYITPVTLVSGNRVEVCYPMAGKTLSKVYAMEDLAIA